MNNNVGFKAFTIIELMVSIFITMIVIASFYKLYDTASVAERSSSIRVSVNLLGEQMLDTISDSVRLIGLNSKVKDFDSYETGVDVETTVIKNAGPDTFQFRSPYGGPITKLAEAATGTYPNCSFKIYNTAALNGNITSFYLHNQDGIYETRKIESGYKQISYDDYFASFTIDGFESVPQGDCGGCNPEGEGECVAACSDGDCKKLFPAGTLISGADRLFTLYFNNGSLLLCTQDTDTFTEGYSENNCIVKFKSVNAGNDYKAQTYEMPRFMIQYLVEQKSGNSFTASWVNNANVNNFRKNIIAVRFGFILVSTKDRNKVGGKYSGTTNEYCIFGGDSGDCYPSESDPDKSWNPNNTAYVFRRVVYLSNHRLLKDAISR